ncbi:hypothetical protein Q4F19_03490 [Sphingomonas sp. BIUV-7]|uniref:DUF6680 domain-containing protein n=1 Tax=Sphingomonas natans TaxID=3063330 RepID=A0ABT8Y542_9SPHN|nr:DUF6680 family protein [Sphingomonas sp. BIUV-7]MDO6413437.1 hypothetical protein [Sphingomonas sp. BIUV-7]
MVSTNAVVAVAAPATSHFIFSLSDLAIILATLLGPILAIQAQKWLERSKAVKDRRLTIFRTLMATRATRISPQHVEALNAVPVDFYGPDKPRLRAITDDWQSYMDLLNDTSMNSDAGSIARGNALVAMLRKIANLLGYNFNESDIKRVYHPEGLVTTELEHAAIRRGIVRMFAGEISLPMSVKEFPSDPEFSERQSTLNALATEWLMGERAVKVSGESSPDME